MYFSREPYLKTVDIDTCSLDEYNSFMTNYEKDYPDLCVDAKRKHVFDLYWVGFPKKVLTLVEFDQFRASYPHLTIHYLYQNGIIRALSVVSLFPRENRAILNLLCSHKKKGTKEGESLGRYLLDVVYDKYVEAGRYTMIVEPARYTARTHEALTAYYTFWKKPDGREDIYDQKDGTKTEYKSLVYKPKTHIGDAIILFGLLLIVWKGPKIIRSFP